MRHRHEANQTLTYGTTTHGMPTNESQIGKKITRESQQINIISQPCANEVTNTLYETHYMNKLDHDSGGPRNDSWRLYRTGSLTEVNR